METVTIEEVGYPVPVFVPLGTKNHPDKMAAGSTRVQTPPPALLESLDSCNRVPNAG